MNPIGYLPFAGLGVILAVLAFVCKCHRSDFPHCEVGYRHQKLMESRGAWDYGNRVTGNLCAVWSAVLFLACVLLYVCHAGAAVALGLLFMLSITAIGCILILPIRLAGRRNLPASRDAVNQTRGEECAAPADPAGKKKM